MASKALTVGAYHAKLVELAAHPDVELLAVAPDAWVESGRQQVAERVPPAGYGLEYTRLWLNGHYHLYLFAGLGRIVRRFRPDVLHIDEEPYNVATGHACRLAHKVGARCVFFAWQNLRRAYPPPFRWLERYVYARAAGIAGTQAAAQVLRGKGFNGPLAVVPQFGVDPELFAPGEPRPVGDRFRIGYAGRLVPEKGVDVLIRAVHSLGPQVELLLAGSGPAEPELRRLAASSANVRFVGTLPSRSMPDFFRSLDAFVQPTLGRRGWTEQFGRSAVEAMACGVPTVASDAGELPGVVGEGGRLVPAGDAQALATALEELRGDPESRGALGQAGRARVLAHYTHARIAEATAGFYRRVLSQDTV